MPKRNNKKLKRPKYKNPSRPVKISNLTFHKLNWLEWVALILGLWFLVNPNPYRELLALLLALPIVGIVLNGLQKPSIASLVEISKDKDGNDKYDVADFIDFPALIILLRVLLDFEFESIYSMIIPGTVACAVMMVVLFMTHRMIENSTKSKWWIYTSLLFNVGLYSYAGTYAANCAYDTSRPEVYETKVLAKNISRGKHTSYYVTVAPWGHRYDKEEIKVSKIQYEEINVNDMIKIDLKKGLFNIPWFYIERK